MTVYDIIRLNPVGAHNSYPPGAVLVDHDDDETRAAERATRFNGHCAYAEYRYFVEAHDELSPDRKPWCGDVCEDGTIRNPADYGGRRHTLDWTAA